MELKIDSHTNTGVYPLITDYTYWKRKTQFLLETDQYPEWTMFALEEGSFSFEIETSHDIARFGDIVICPPQVPMTRHVLEPLTFHFIAFTWCDPCSSKTKSVLPILPSGKISIQDLNLLLNHYSNLRKLEEKLDPISNQWRNVLLANICYLYFNESKLEQKMLVKADPLIEEARILLNQVLFTPINVTDIARKLGMSSVQFSRRYLKHTGMTPIDYITSMRIQKGRVLLLETSMNLEKIAEECGYSSGFYFSRIFTKRMKMSPSQYRKLHR
jgi:AraC family transcriptional regulator